MKSLFSILVVAVFGTCCASTVQAATLQYWSFNSETLTPDIGDAGTTLFSADIGFGGHGYGAGTSLNTVEGYPAGRALDYYAAVASSFQQLTFTNLNFTNAVDARLSFATFSTNVFEIGEYMAVAYSTDGGSSYHGTQVLANPTSGWSLREVDFGTALNGYSNVRIRLQTSATFEVGTRLGFDNVQIVPEPSTMALCGVGAFAVLGVFLRRKRSA